MPERSYEVHHLNEAGETTFSSQQAPRYRTLSCVNGQHLICPKYLLGFSSAFSGGSLTAPIKCECSCH